MEKESMVKEFKKPSVKTYKGSIYPLRIFNESKKLFAQRDWFIKDWTSSKEDIILKSRQNP